MNVEINKLISESKARQTNIKKGVYPPLYIGTALALITIVLLTIGEFVVIPSFISWITTFFCLPFIFWCLILVIKDEWEAHIQRKLRSQNKD